MADHAEAGETFGQSRGGVRRTAPSAGSGAEAGSGVPRPAASLPGVLVHSFQQFIRDIHAELTKPLKERSNCVNSSQVLCNQEECQRAPDRDSEPFSAAPRLPVVEHDFLVRSGFRQG